MSKTQLGRDTSGPYETPTSRKLATKRFLQKRPVQASLILVLAAVIVFSWQLLNNTANSTDPSIAGHPLSNPHTHLHTIALGVRPSTLYLGTHFGMFTSTDGGKSWPQPRGALNTMMITAIAASPSNPDSLAVVAIPVSGVGVQSGVYFSHDGSNTWNARSPAGLSLSAYPYTVKAGSAGGGHFYAFYNYAGWYETRDMGLHWYAITADALSNMQTPSLLTDPANADHLWLGGDSGLYETRDDGEHWNHIATVKGNVAAIVASTTTPRLTFCATDQGSIAGTREIYRSPSLLTCRCHPCHLDSPSIVQAAYSMPFQVKTSGKPAIAGQAGCTARASIVEISSRWSLTHRSHNTCTRVSFSQRKSSPV